MNNSDLGNRLETYITNKSFDYAILVNGCWGCGKTFYFKNEFKSICESNDLIQLVVSLGGLQSSLDVMKAIGRSYFEVRLIKDNKALKAIDVILSEDISCFLPEGKVKTGIDIAKNAVNFIMNIGTDSSANNNLILILDDFERYKGDPQELMSLIQTRYVDNKVHVICRR